MCITRHSGHLLGGINGPNLGALGNRHHERLGAVFVTEAKSLGRDKFWCELPFLRGNGVELQPAHSFWCTTFIGVDVRRGAADHSTPPRHHRGQRDNIRPGAVEERKHFGLGTEGFLDFGPQRGGVIVTAVGDLVATVGPLDGRQYLRQDSGIIVAGETSPRG